MDDKDLNCWVITEGMAGTENQCIGVANAIGITPEIKRISLKQPWKTITPYIRILDKYSLTNNSSDLLPPYPDLILSSGRKSIATTLRIKQENPDTIIVNIQDPRINPNLFDLVIVPKHDPARGKNVIVTDIGLHKVTPELIAGKGQKLNISSPSAAVLIGGDSKAFKFTEEICLNTAKQLNKLANSGVSLMITTSRRTSQNNIEILKANLTANNILFWDGNGENPYFAYLDKADYIIITEDSVSMISEAIAIGKPIFIIRLEGGAKRLNSFHANLKNKNLVKDFEGKLEKYIYTPLNDTIMVANEIKKLMKEYRKNV